MDTEALIVTAKFPVAFMGNHDATDVELIELDATQASPGIRADLEARGFTYLGCAGIFAGKAVCALEDMSAQTAHMLASAHAEYIFVRLVCECLAVAHA